MLVSLMYHHVESNKYTNSSIVIGEHFKYISKKFVTIYPQEYKKSIFNTQLCLVFDDAYFDFYHYVYPLLKKYKIKAILAVPTSYILDSSILSSRVRLDCTHDEIMVPGNYEPSAQFCTWDEINEMANSGFVEVASHGVKHLDLQRCDRKTCLSELVLSKKIIKLKTGLTPKIFVYPYGKYDKNILGETNLHYLFSFSIGRFININPKNTVIHRINADSMKNPLSIFSLKSRIIYIILSLLISLVPNLRNKV